MLSELATRLEALEEKRRRLLELLDGLSEEQRGFRPGPDSWSLVDVGHHLQIAEATVAMAITARPAGQRPRRSARQRLLSVALAVVLRFGWKVKAPSKRLEPDGSLDLAGLRREWAKSGLELRRVLEEVEPGELGEIAFRHPISGPLDFEQGLDFLLRHFDHHLRQVGRIRAAPGFPATDSPAP